MATAREIKRRIRSVKNIGQITRALEAVSASRVRRAQARVLASRIYAHKAFEILLNVQQAAGAGDPLHPLLTSRAEVNNVMLIVVTADRGLAGAYNANVLRVAQRFAHRIGKPIRYVTIGRKGRDTLVRTGVNLIAEFSNLPAEPGIADISPIARVAIDEFLSGTVDEVFIAYTDFINLLTQRPVVQRMLPLTPYDPTDGEMREMVKEPPQVTSGVSDYEYEPNSAAILDEIVPRFTVLQLYQDVLESRASEEAARMVAMRNASDNAAGLADDLTLIYNKARQSAITSEILDIVGGAEALQATLDAVADKIEVQLASTNGHGATPAIPTQRDNLTRIEGIGPKIAAALNAAGIYTYAQLAHASEAQLTAALQAAKLRFAPSLPTWPQQAAYAAQGDWDGLEAFQSQLTAGRN
jgi:F-type H+-transporting ATPase subunit gamma